MKRTSYKDSSNLEELDLDLSINTYEIGSRGGAFDDIKKKKDFDKPIHFLSKIC